MSMYGVVAALETATKTAKKELAHTNKVMLDINRKIMSVGAVPRIQQIWSELYQQWTSFALQNPLLHDSDPRMPVEDIRQSVALARTIKKKALIVYQQFLNKPEARRAAMGAARAQKKAEAKEKRGSVFKAIITGATILGGAASAHVLYSAWRGKKKLDQEADRVRESEAEQRALAKLASQSIQPIVPPLYNPHHTPIHDSHAFRFSVPSDDSYGDE